MASPNWVRQQTQLSQATVNACLRELVELGIVKEVTGQKRNRLYSYTQYISIMNQRDRIAPVICFYGIYREQGRLNKKQTII